MAELPAGTVTFLFTDIEGSTRLLAELGERYSEVLAEHHRIVRGAVERHEGVEVDTQGDAFFVAFVRASDAVAAASAAQAALAVGPVRVRMGLHTGEPRLTDEGYLGIDVHRAARIGNAANGGQVVLSPTTRQLLDESVELRDLGEHRLKDFPTATRLFQLGIVDFPPLRTPDEARLPLAPTPLIGRKKELADAVRLVGSERARLLTVTGAGGVGKTRFAVEVATEAIDGFTDGARFLDLSPLRSPDAVLPALAQSVRARGAVEEALRDQEILLVLDNAEHVVDAAPQLGAILGACQGVSMLVTSREPLHLGLERELPLHPMPEAPAVELFRQRAQMVDPDFEGEYGVLVEICARLDGLPLAIELAAARVKILGAPGLLERLDRRLPLLTGRSRDAPERQRTLRAAIEWSYDLLNDEEQRVLVAISVFVGGFTVDAAEAVVGTDLDTLESLMEKSLVRQEEGRLSMLETIREFAEELLDASEDADETRRRHAEFFLDLAERAQVELRGRDQLRWFDLLSEDYANLRSALEWGARFDGEVELRLAAALAFFWRVRGNLSEGLAWLEDALERGSRHPSRVAALSMASLLAFFVGDRARATEHAEEALILARELGDRRGLADAMVSLANAVSDEADSPESEKLLEDAKAIFEEVGDSSGVARAANNIANLALRRGEFGRAREFAEESAAVAAEVGDERAVCIALVNAALAAKEAGAAADAQTLNLEALRRSWRLRYLETVAAALEEIASFVPEVRSEDGARLLGAAEAVRERISAPRVIAREQAILSRSVEETRRRLGPTRFAEALAAGRTMPLHDAVQLALRSLD